MQRRHFNQTVSLKDRLAAFAKEIREKAEQLSGPERDALLKKAGKPTLQPILTIGPTPWDCSRRK
jgi:hypothetical protein